MALLIDDQTVPAMKPVRCCNRHRMRPGRGPAESSAGALLFPGHHLTDADSQLIIEQPFSQTVPAGEELRVIGFSRPYSPKR
jgi:hypothetical protein